MKKSLLFFATAIVVMTASLSFSMTGQVSGKVELVQHLLNYPVANKATLVVNACLVSMDGDDHYIRGLNFAFQLNDTMRHASPVVYFVDKVFLGSSTPGAVPYQSTEDYRAIDGRIRMIYTYNGGNMVNIGPSSTRILTIKIIHDMIDANGAVTWFSGLPTFYVADEQGYNLTADLLPMAGNLAKIPLNSSNGLIPAKWMLPMTITSDQTVLTLEIGGDSLATDGYDLQYDLPAPPPGLDYYAYLNISPAFPNSLFRDVRPWVRPYENEIIWTIMVNNAVDRQTAIAWNAESLPAEGFFDIAVGDDPAVPLVDHSQVQFVGNRVVTVRYRSIKEFAFHFAHQGWYLVSLPLAVENPTVANLFPTAISGLAFAWNNQTQTYDTVTELQAGVGYWIAFPEACDVILQGSPFRQNTAQLSIGWNLVGSLFEAVSLNELQTTPEGSAVPMIFYWDDVEKRYTDSDQFNPGLGYWVLATQACEMVLTSGTAALSQVSAPGVAQLQSNQLPPSPPLIAVDPTASATIRPERFELKSIYPNPFNATAMVAFDISDPGQVQIDIFNILGVRVRTLLKKEMAAGTYKVQWDGLDGSGQAIPSGLLIFRMITATHIQSRTALLLK